VRPLFSHVAFRSTGINSVHSKISTQYSRVQTEELGAESLPDAAHRPSRRDLPSLDGLRALSIIFVIVGHALEGRSGILAALSSRLANFGVSVFFVISGYLITTILLRGAKREGRIDLRRFYLRRVLRIVPPYYTYLVVLAVGVALGLWTQPRSARWWPALTFLSDLFTTNDSLTIHSWSLSLEEQFYLIWPVTFSMCVWRRGLETGARLAAKLAISSLLLFPLIKVFAFGWTRDGALVSNLNFEYVAAGSALVLLLEYRSPLVNRLKAVIGSPSEMLPLCGLAAITLHMLFAQSMRWTFALDVAVVTPVEAVLLAVFIAWAIENPHHLVGRSLNILPLLIIGIGSYSLYLWQQLYIGPWSPFHLSLPIALAAAVAWAAGSYWLIERPALVSRTYIENYIFNISRRSTESPA
jgi:peptidoglycan/LPS O-acetylase OafA/YrhL